MAAAPGGEKIFARLGSVHEAIQQKRDEFNDYLTWMAKQLADLPSFPAITRKTSLTADTRLIENLVDLLNRRVDVLRHRGCNLDDRWAQDAGGLIFNAIRRLRGTEMARSVLKDAVADAEQDVWDILHKLYEIEREQIWNWLNKLVDAVGECLGREASPSFLQWATVSHEFRQLRDVLDDEMNPDAIWLVEQQDRLASLEELLTDEEVWHQAFGEHEKIVSEVLEEAAALGVKVGARQKLITEYYRAG